MGKNSWKDKIGRSRIYSVDHEGRDDIVLWDVMEIAQKQTLKIVFISKNSTYAQGVRLAIDAGEGILEIDGTESKNLHLWYDTSPPEVIMQCKSKEGLLSIYNIFQDRHFPESQRYGSGMLVEQDGNRTIYKCHDVSMINVSFDKLVFSIEKI